jgi:hypothetical protein
MLIGALNVERRQYSHDFGANVRADVSPYHRFVISICFLANLRFGGCPQPLIQKLVERDLNKVDSHEPTMLASRDDLTNFARHKGSSLLRNEAHFRCVGN